MAHSDDERDYRDSRDFDDEPNIRTSIAVMRVQLRNIQNDLATLVTRQEFTPVKLLAYGLAGSMLAGVVAAILAQIIHK